MKTSHVVTRLLCCGRRSSAQGPLFLHTTQRRHLSVLIVTVYTPTGLIYFVTILIRIMLLLMWYLLMKRDLARGWRRRDLLQLESTLWSACSAVVVGGSDTTSNLVVMNDQSIFSIRKTMKIENTNCNKKCYCL